MRSEHIGSTYDELNISKRVEENNLFTASLSLSSHQEEWELAQTCIVSQCRIGTWPHGAHVKHTLQQSQALELWERHNMMYCLFRVGCDLKGRAVGGMGLKFLHTIVRMTDSHCHTQHGC